MSGINRLSWHQITKGGLPDFVVVRPLSWNDDTVIEPGAKFPGANPYLTRNLYEQNWIAVAPAIAEEQPKPKSNKKGR